MGLRSEIEDPEKKPFPDPMVKNPWLRTHGSQKFASLLSSVRPVFFQDNRDPRCEIRHERRGVSVVEERHHFRLYPAKEIGLIIL
jgi:hypothetical protein